jgi:hypothetical protein
MFKKKKNMYNVQETNLNPNSHFFRDFRRHY